MQEFWGIWKLIDWVPTLNIKNNLKFRERTHDVLHSESQKNDANQFKILGHSTNAAKESLVFK